MLKIIIVYVFIYCIAVFKQQYLDRLNQCIEANNNVRKDQWSKSIAVGSKGFIEKTRKSLKAKVLNREDINRTDCYELREEPLLYNAIDECMNEFIWDI